MKKRVFLIISMSYCFLISRGLTASFFQKLCCAPSGLFGFTSQHFNRDLWVDEGNLTEQFTKDLSTISPKYDCCRKTTDKSKLQQAYERYHASIKPFTETIMALQDRSLTKQKQAALLCASKNGHYSVFRALFENIENEDDRKTLLDNTGNGAPLAVYALQGGHVALVRFISQKSVRQFFSCKDTQDGTVTLMSCASQNTGSWKHMPIQSKKLLLEVLFKIRSTYSWPKDFEHLNDVDEKAIQVIAEKVELTDYLRELKTGNSRKYLMNEKSVFLK